MLWSKVLIAFNSSKESWRAVEYVGQVLSNVEGVKVEVVWIYEKVPEYDMVDTPFTGQVKGNIHALERERQEGIQKMEEAQKHLLRMGLAEDSVSLKPMEKKKGVAKDLVAEAVAGDYGTVVLGGTGKSGVAGMLLGSVSSAVVSGLPGAAVTLVQ